MMEDLFGNTVLSGLPLIDQAVREYQPSHLFAMFSGGHDSLCATHIAAQHPAFSAAVHINTGIGIEQTRQYVCDTCAQFGWPLIEYHAKADCGQDYEQIVLEHGFPGPASHLMMFTRLKERAIRRLAADHKQGRHDRIIYISGARSQESARRMRTAAPIQRDGVRVWVAPIHDWSSSDKHEYMLRHGLPDNPVVKLLCKSGECLCGAYAHPGELAEIEMWYPEVGKRIRDLEARVREAGHSWGWEDAPPDPGEVDNQTLPLCWSCSAKHDRAKATT